MLCIGGVICCVLGGQGAIFLLFHTFYPEHERQRQFYSKLQILGWGDTAPYAPLNSAHECMADLFTILSLL